MRCGGVLQAAKLFALACLTALVPPRLWHRVAVAIAGPLGRAEDDPDRLLYLRLLGLDPDSREAAELHRRRRAWWRESQLQILGLLGPWRAWRPRVRLRGEQHVRAALASGRGAILWMAEFACSDLAMKIAFHQAGYDLCQLSRPEHGFAADPLAIRYLNPLWTGVEDRFLSARVVIENNETAPALSILRDRLAQNGVVVITVGHEARRLVEIPFLGDRIHLPTGPAKLAQQAGAALLPVFPLAAEEDGTVFEVIVEPPLPVPPADNGPGALAGVPAVYAKRLEPYVRAHPDQWRGWSYLVPRKENAECSGRGAALASGHTSQTVI
jgi:lauroyl/myristoyl acyltransferase